MRRIVNLAAKSILCIILVVIGLIGWRAYSRPHTHDDWALAQAALAAGDRQTAVVHLRNVVRQNPNHGQAYLEVSKLFLEHARLHGRPATYADNERAFTFLTQAAKLLPKDAELQRRLLALYLDKGKVTEAIEVAGRLADRAGDDADVVAARAFHSVRQYERSAVELKKVLAVEGTMNFQALKIRADLDVAVENDSHLQKLLDGAIDRATNEGARKLALLTVRERDAMAGLMRTAVAQAANEQLAASRTDRALQVWEGLAKLERTGALQSQLISAAADEASQLASLFAEKYPQLDRGDRTPGKAVDGFADRAEKVRQVGVQADSIRTATRMISVRYAYHRGELLQAADIAERGIAGAKNRKEALELRFAAGRLFLASRSPRADKQIEDLLADREWRGWGRLLAGERALLAAQPQDALVHFRAALPLLGHTRDVRAGFADAFLALGRWDEARAELSGLVRFTTSAPAGLVEESPLGDLPHRTLLLELYRNLPEATSSEL